MNEISFNVDLENLKLILNKIGYSGNLNFSESNIDEGIDIKLEDITVSIGRDDIDEFDVYIMSDSKEKLNEIEIIVNEIMGFDN